MAPTTEALAQDAAPLVCQAVTNLQTDLDGGFGHRAVAFHWLDRGGFQARLEKATLDAAEGFAANPTDWPALFTGTLGLADDLGQSYEPEIEGPLWIATHPAPAYDLSVTTDRGTITVRLPDTRSTRFGASFAVAADGATYWGDADHDGVVVADRLTWQEALVAEHLARGADDPTPDPGAPPDPGPTPSEGTAGAASTRAFTVSPDGAPVRLGRPDGSSLPPEELPWALGEAFDVLDEGASVGSTAWKGETGRAHPLRAEAADLSDCAGWPDVAVEPGTLAVDPGLGRFAMSAGDPDRAVAPRSHFYQHWNIANSLLVEGDRAYTTIGESDASFVVVDLSDPTRPERVAWGNAGWAYGVVLAEGYAHAWGRNVLTTFALPAEGEREPTQVLVPTQGTPRAVRLRDGRLEAFFSDGLSSATSVGGGSAHVAEITRLKGNQMLSATANGLYLTDVPRSPDTPAGPLTARWFAATAPPDDPGTCGDDDDGDPLPPTQTDDCACEGSGASDRPGPWGLCLVVALIAPRRRRT